ncbi:MAG: molybdopterin molybdotransferase MoeA [Thermoplasmata archaeon]
MEMHAFGRLLPMWVAQRRLLGAVRPISRIEPVRVTDGFGRIAARSVTAPRPVPSFARATWDGYAVRSLDTRTARASRPIRLRVVGDVFAEGRFSRRLAPGESVAIATGGAMPRGADGVVIFEDVEREGAWVSVPHPVGRGDRTAPAGDDFPRGTTLVSPGEELTPSALGALAACGFATVPCFARPVVSIVPNGNELILPGRSARPGAIYESNNVSLSAIITAAGGVPRPFPPVPDDPRQIEATLRRALATSDLVLATGGSSVGERDLLPRVLPRIGRLLFHGIAVRPGKPTLAALARGKLIVGLPGHPSSCLANSYWLVLPLLQKLARRPGPAWNDATVRLGRGVLAPTPGLATVVPLTLRNGRAYSTFHGSSSISSMSQAKGFVVLAPGRNRLRAGARLRVHWLRSPLGPDGEPTAGNR